MENIEPIVSSPGTLTAFGIALASLASSVSLGWFLGVLLRFGEGGLVDQQGNAHFDVARHQLLARKSLACRWLAPLVSSAARSQLLMKLVRVEQVRSELSAGCLDAPWTPELFIAATAVQSLVVGMASTFLMKSSCSLPVATLLGLFLSIALFYGTLYWLRSRAMWRRGQFFNRLPFAVDLIAMLMESGATFREAVVTVVNENADHPVGEEFDTMLRELDRGQTLFDALLSLQSRIGQVELSELVFTIQKAQELGTPLGRVFVRLAGQMRIQRSQAAEKAAGKANANITFPGLLVMFACVLLIVSPFVLKAIDNSSMVF